MFEACVAVVSVVQQVFLERSDIDALGQAVLEIVQSLNEPSGGQASSH